eukprot:7025453-Pyramimonas_sp.AAC.1
MFIVGPRPGLRSGAVPHPQGAGAGVRQVADGGPPRVLRQGRRPRPREEGHQPARGPVAQAAR